MQFTIGRLRGGFAVSWIDGGKRRRFQLKARSRKAAEAEAVDIIRRETAPVGGLTVAAIWEAYRDDRAGRPIAHTMGYSPAVLGHFGHLRPDQVSTTCCREFTAARRAHGRSDGTIWTELGHLRTALGWAAKRRLIERAPYIERPAKPAPRERWLTRPEIARLLDAATIPHVRLAIHLMIATAGRIGAILELTWDRVDLHRGQIDLRLDALGPRKGRAVVPINAGLRAALAAAKEASLSDYVVEWGGGRVRSIRKGFQSACSAAGLRGVTQHSLRHSAAVHLVAAGIPIEMVAQMLGHSNVAMTFKVYARFAPQHMAAAADVLEFAPVQQPKARSVKSV
jgi:integrase